MSRRTRIAVLVGLALLLGVALVLWWLPAGVDAEPVAEADRPARFIKPAQVAKAPPVLQPAKPQKPKRVMLRCELPSELADAVEARGRGAEGSPGPPLPLDDGAVLLPSLRPPTDPEASHPSMAVRFPGYGTATLAYAWDGEAWSCEVRHAKAFGYVTGKVIASDGIADDRILVVGCGSRTRTDRDGGFYMEVSPEPCDLRAMRRDGVFQLRSDPVRVNPTSGQDVVLDLKLPKFKAAGVGVGVAEHDLGVRITGVYQNTPAWDAGMRKGDVVIAVDGKDTVELGGVMDFVDHALGPEGTEVAYTVLRNGEEVEIVMAREPIERLDM